ncbi:MAG: hypothetical protein LC689_12610 [Myxococcales bacterium]|nr:hypothetical protein [Myxococcales bacterium]
MNDLRILAVQAEPPEAQYDDTSADPVHLRILAVDPPNEGAFALMKWDICAPTDSRRCLDGPIIPQAAGSQTRHGGHEFSADIVIPSGLVSLLVGNDKLGGYLGTFFAQFSFSVDDGDPHSPIYADKSLVYSRRGSPPNHNPLLTGLALTINGAPDRTLSPGEILTLKIGVEYGIRPLLAADARETYDTTDLTGKPVHLTEQPGYSFFTTPGAEFDRDTADEPFDGVAPPDGLTRIDAFRAGSGTMWVVVRDGRGGESWIEVPWTSS